MASALHPSMPPPHGCPAAMFAVNSLTYDADRSYGSIRTPGTEICASAGRSGLSATLGCWSAQPYRDAACLNNMLRRPNRHLRPRRACMLHIKQTMRPTK